MFSFRIAIVSLVLIPTIASAQRRMRGEVRADWDAIGNSTSGPSLSARDMENASPLKLLADKRKDLKLSDELANQLRELETKDKEKNKSLLKAVDSLRAVVRSVAASKRDEDRVRATLARQELRTTVQSILANYDTTLTGALPLLDETQKEKATALLEKHQQQSDEEIREKLGGGRPSPAGAPAPTTRRRP